MFRFSPKMPHADHATIGELLKPSSPAVTTAVAKRAPLSAALAMLILFVAMPALAQDAKKGGAEEGFDFSEEDAKIELVYTGEFIDQENAPIAGLFPLEFKLYSSPKSKKSLWHEEHFVSVVDGGYVVALGLENPLPEQSLEETVYLAVELKGKEMVRQPIEPKVIRDEVRTGLVRSGGDADYAATCGDAATLGGQGPEAFASAAVEKTLNDHLADKAMHGGNANAAGSGGGATLGTQSQKTDYAGGSGGKVYSLNCPEGYVVTGVEGRSGAVLDSIRIVCTELN